MAAAGARIPRSRLIRFEHATKAESRPYGVFPPGQAQRFAAFLAHKLVEGGMIRRDQLGRSEAVIQKALEPYEAIFATKLGGELMHQIRSLCSPIEELFDGQTINVNGLAVRFGSLTRTLRAMKLPHSRARNTT